MLAITEDKVYKTRLYSRTSDGWSKNGRRLKTAEWLIRADSANDAETMAVAYAVSKFGGEPLGYEAEVVKLISRDVLAEIPEVFSAKEIVAIEDRELAQRLVDASNKYASGDDDGDTDIEILEAEGAILHRLVVPLDETELGLTKNAVDQIEKFVSEQLGSPWSYSDAGLLGQDAAR